MRYYFAPMEGLTDSIFRRLHHEYFGGVDRYYMPFMSPTVHRSLTPREARELPFAPTVPFSAIPQLLTKVPEDFLWAAQVCRDRGYEEVNLNIGCPSGTVVAKGKGAGMLADTAALDAFLDAIYEKAPLPISVKTRLGIAEPEEFYAILEVLNRYPIAELTIHPRVRKQFYDGSVHKDLFRYAAAHSSNPLCYNGDLCSTKDISAIAAEFPEIDAVMLGRGLVGDPGMLIPGGTTRDALARFLTALLEEYTVAFGGSRNAMFRLKENWSCILKQFPCDEKLSKQLRKTTDVTQFRTVAAQLIHSLPLP